MASMVRAQWRESLERLRQAVQRVFQRWLPERTAGSRGAQIEAWSPSWLGLGGPLVDVEEDDEAIYVTAEMPGLDKDDFRLELFGDRLVLYGEKKVGRERRTRDYYYSECSYGAFSRSIVLPCEVDAGRTEARYRNGVLTVRLPKTESARARRVKVKVR